MTDLDQRAAQQTSLISRTVARNQYIPHLPTVKQTYFLLIDDLECLYGGAAGGGKSDALLMAALQYVDVPGYSAVIFRRTFPQLNQPDALIPRSKEWLSGTDAEYNKQEHRWTFPSGATLTFASMKSEDDKYNYQGAAYQFIGFDELTQFTNTQYTYLISRLRRLEGFPVPLRIRSSSNPGGVGHDWVMSRFAVTEGKDSGTKPFIPAGLDDNPHLDRAEYEKALEELDPITRKQLRHGDWRVRGKGEKFERDWFEIIEFEDLPWNPKWVRAWDTASTPKTPQNNPDWTVGLLMAKKDGIFYIVDVKRFRDHSGGVEALVRKKAAQDESDCSNIAIRMGHEGGSSGDHMILDYAKKLARYSFEGIKETGSKWVRANPCSAAASNGIIKVVRAPWNLAFFGELEAFREDEKEYDKDDQVDALTLAYNHMAGVRMGSGPMRVSSTGGRTNPLKS